MYHVKEQVKRWYKGQNGENATLPMEQADYKRFTDDDNSDSRSPKQVTTTLIEISRDDY